jgi:subtilisin family serine protease
MSAPLFSRRGKIVLSLLFVAALALSPIVSAGPAERPPVSIESRVLDQIAQQGEATYWVILREKADLRPAFAMKNWEARGRFVYERLRATANASQAGIRTLLQSRGVSHRPFWIVNAIRVTSDKATLQDLVARPEVAQVVADGSYKIPDPIPGQQQPRVNAVEWNIDRINAPQVWSGFGVRGEGIVVANVDTGVEFTHSALVAQYRGNLGGGVFNHDYAWFDPTGICGSVPCDNNAHGTHTMGTMVGDDGSGNQIGVAPGARWIAAKGCASSSCSFTDLTLSGEWMLAPTRSDGSGADPNMRPHVVNNSWGGGPGDPFYQGIVDAWNASGIFPAFSNGNSGPFCNSSGSPGDYLNTYSAGAFDINNNIAFFSSRGPSAFGGETKPNIAAPGVDVRSSVPGNSYAFFSGTSMASPHIAGTVALIWSAAPAAERDIATTRALLDQAGVDTEDLSCGGTAQDNNVWGEGRLDAFAAVDLAPRGPTGFLEGLVTDAFASPIPGATVQAVGPVTRTTTTDVAGQYNMRLPVGTYDATASFFGFLPRTEPVDVITDTITIRDFALSLAPSHAVSGFVRDSTDNPIANATVTILNTPIPPALTDANGFYSFASVPEGTYDVRAEAGRCNDAQTQPLVVDGPETLDFTLPQRVDSFGYFCQVVPFTFIDATTELPLFGDDGVTQVSLPFPFTFYGQTYNTAFVSTNGFLNVLGPVARFFNEAIPNPNSPNAAIYGFWDDLYVDFGAASVRTELLGEAPNRQYVIEWRNVAFCCISFERVRFEIVLHENGRILMQYTSIDANGREQGDSATVGIENETGTIAFQYSFDERAISEGLAVLYRLPPSGFVDGRVADLNDGLPVAGATVRALQGGAQVRATTTGADGLYRVQLPLGGYTLEASAPNYSTESAPAVLDDEDEIVPLDFDLRTPRIEATPTSFQFVVPVGQTRTKTLTISNTGSLNMVWEIRETGGRAVLTRQGSGVWLYQSATGVPMRTNTGGTGLAYPSAFRWRPAQPSSPLSILIYADDAYHTAPNTYLDRALQHLALPYTAHYNADFFGFESDLASQSWDLVLFGNDNWFPPDSTLTALNNYVAGGGKLVLNSWTIGFNPGHPLWQTLGFTWISDDFDPPDPVRWWQPDHPIFTDPESVPEPTQLTGFRYGIYGQRVEPRAGFEALAGYTTPGPDPNQAAMIVGNDDRTVFKGFLDGQNDADRDADSMQDGVELWINLITGIQTGFPTDVPWLTETPTSGTLAPGGSQPILVTVDATGLTPGVYHANLVIRSNSARQPSLRISVNLIVPAYQQAANAGGGAYTDLAGDIWAADKKYAAGSWGYVNRSTTKSTSKPISGTDDDRLYQDLRDSILEYRFDGLPAGVYQIELLFAEVKPTLPNLRRFDVTIESNLVLDEHDIALEVGSFAADRHTFFLTVTDGQLNVRFIPTRGYGTAIVNAVRVTHRPDR